MNYNLIISETETVGEVTTGIVTVGFKSQGQTPIYQTFKCVVRVQGEYNTALDNFDVSTWIPDTFNGSILVDKSETIPEGELVSVYQSDDPSFEYFGNLLKLSVNARLEPYGASVQSIEFRFIS